MNKQLLLGFWEELDHNTWKAGLFCLLLTIAWGLISTGLYLGEGPRSYFQLQAVLEFKILLAAMVFLGRYNMFRKYRQKNWFPWLAALSFLLIACFSGVAWFKAGWLYAVLRFGDMLIWAVFLGALLEVCGGVCLFWFRVRPIHPANFQGLWLLFWDELTGLGILMTLLAGLAYYYLCSFYLIDTMVYSYLLLAIVELTGLSLFVSTYSKMNHWVRQDLKLIDEELGAYIEWGRLKNDPEFYQKLLWFEYLTLVRGYLLKNSRPRVRLKPLLTFIIAAVFLLGLPYLFGLAIEVSSFK